MKLSYVGDYRWRPGDSGAFLDILSITLEPNGTYTAQVEATLVNAAVRSTVFPCTLPESGLWSAYEVVGQKRIRLRPSTSKARVYVVESDNDQLSLSRRGTTTRLFAESDAMRASA